VSLGQLPDSLILVPMTDSEIQDSNCHAQMQSISNEIWREIASFLSRRDLRSLIFVPHPLSSIARQLLFRDISVVFGADDLVHKDRDDAVKKEKRHARLSAEILSQLIADPACASQVKTFKVWAPEDSRHILFSLFMGVLTFPPESRSVDQCIQ
jgi:hypothetical protein